MNLETFIYTSEKTAIQTWRGIPRPTKRAMAKVYQAAFGGEPWKEKWRCPNCGSYLPDNNCGRCKLKTRFKAYTLKDLVKTDMLNMLVTFAPGMLALARVSDQIVGFTTGGLVNLETLINKKYTSENPKLIFDSVATKFNLIASDQVFYDNETCVLPELQGQKIGKQLSLVRIEAATSLNANIICGRTINMPWLKLKEEQLTQAGYTFAYQVPEGDTYQVDGTPRYFYIAKRN